MKNTLFILSVLAISCSSGPDTETVSAQSSDTVQVQLQETLIPESQEVAALFESIDTNFNSMDLLLPEGFKYDLLFTEARDKVTRADGKKFPAKGNHDLCVYVPIDGSSTHGYLYVGHEDRYVNADLGDGGGGTVFEVIRDSTGWKTVGDFKHVDFSDVRDTHRNCGGTITPWGTILSAEETYPSSNADISFNGTYISDLSPINGRDAYTNFGWMVEIDPVTQKPLHKLYSMGRFMHEDAECMPDQKTVYLTDDYPVAVFFKFVADAEGDYTSGQLYAYRQSEDGESGDWLEIPRDTNSLIRCRDIALNNGATLFQRHEWLDEADGKLYIAETGNVQFDWNMRMNRGAVPAKHLWDSFHLGGNIFSDVHGRILEFDPVTNKMRSYLEGGVNPEDSATVLSNPDGNCIRKFNGTNYLVINEDIDWYDLGRVPKHAELAQRMVNEVYFLPLNKENPQLSDLRRFAIGPKGSETTGTYFTPDGSTMFLNIQHPYPFNKLPFNRSTTVAITGFK